MTTRELIQQLMRQTPDLDTVVTYEMPDGTLIDITNCTVSGNTAVVLK